MTRKQKKRPKKPEETHTYLTIRVKSYDASINASINSHVYHPQNAWNLNDDDPLYKFTSQLQINGVSIDPEERAGNMYELTIYGDDAPSHHLNTTLKDVHERDAYNAPKYREYRRREIPIYNPPNGMGMLNKVRGQPLWVGWLFVSPRFVNDALVLLGQNKALFMTIRERKKNRTRWIQGMTLQTEDPLEE